jgi:hypothetical protein
MFLAESLVLAFALRWVNNTRNSLPIHVDVAAEATIERFGSCIPLERGCIESGTAACSLLPYIILARLRLDITLSGAGPKARNCHFVILRRFSLEGVRNTK